MTNNTQFGHTECAPVVRECDEKRTDLLDSPLCGLGEDYEPEIVWQGFADADFFRRAQ